jgi:phosphoribosylaminoimidazole-succinocarboxamide synthase
MSEHNDGAKVVADGKTKRITLFEEGDGKLVVVKNIDAVTKNNGETRNLIADKGILSNTTICNVFELLKDCGVPVAFERKLDATSFLAPLCDMIKLEVVARRRVRGSALKRHPYLAEYHRFERLVVELYLKTKDRKWLDHDLPCDDPLAVYDRDRNVFDLYDPATPLYAQEPFLPIPAEEVIPGDVMKRLEQIDAIIRRVVLILEKAWQMLGGCLDDLKLEFGIDPHGRLVVADGISNDEWRLRFNGVEVSKQCFRDDAPLEAVAMNYRFVAEQTACFRLPEQHIIIWHTAPVETGQIKFARATLGTLIPSSMRHIHTVRCARARFDRSLTELDTLMGEVPTAAIVAFARKKSEAYRTICAMSTVPVVQVGSEDSASSQDVAEQVLRILALNSPYFYALLRQSWEEGRVNLIPL